MKLKQLIIHGFKSFKDRIVIDFAQGITGFVGPNGCGKSNIVDAIYWVMGEQSAKHLRGNNMQDVIFSGSQKYGPAAFAEVSLILKNEELKHINILDKVFSPSEIQLTRKLYRDGEAEYRINNMLCRLRDIQEVFMDTGAGAKSYSIIAQGEIERLIRAKPEDRKIIIEEVAGITKFKVRRKESLKKIEQSQENLQKINELRVEIDKNLRRLFDQAQKAKLAKELKESIKNGELNTNANRLYNLYRRIFNTVNNLSSDEDLVIKLKSEKDQLELSLSSERLNQTSSSNLIEEWQRDYNQKSRQLAGQEERIIFLEKSCKEKEELIKDKSKELDRITKQIEERIGKTNSLQEQLDNLNETSSEEFFHEMEEKVLIANTFLQKTKDEQRVISTSIDIVNNKLKEFQQLDYEYQLKKEMLAPELASLSNSSRLAASNIEEIKLQQKSVEAELDQIQKELQQEEEKLAIWEKDKDLLKNTLDNQDADYNKLQRESILTNSKLEALLNLKRDNAGIGEGTKQLLENSDLALFADKISCDPKYEKVVELLLSNFLNALIVDNPITSLDISDLKTISWNNFYPSKSVDGLIPLSEIITTDLPKDIFNGFFVATDFSQINVQADFISVATCDGSKLMSKLGGITTYIDQESVAGIISRNNKIEILMAKQQEEENLVAKNKNEKISLDAKYEELLKHGEKLRLNLASINQTIAKLESKRDLINENLKTKTNLNESTLKRIDEINLLISSLVGLSEGNQKSLQESKQELEELLSKSKIVETSLTGQEQTYFKSKEEFDLILGKKTGREDHYNDLMRELEDSSNQLLVLNTNVEEIQTQLSSLKDKLDLENDDFSRIKQESSDLANLLRTKETDIKGLNEALAQLSDSMQEREDKIKKIITNINSLEKEIVESNVRLEQMVSDEELLVKDLFEKYHVDLRSIVSSDILGDKHLAILKDVSHIFYGENENGEYLITKELFTFEKLDKEKLEELSLKLKQDKASFNRIGEVNWFATDEYEEQQKRSEFLKAQEDELKKSIADLMNAIARIDEKSKIRFADAFNSVNERFKKVFPIIFGGGFAELKVVTVDEELDGGIDIMASPPGKNLQNIILMSGGEKAMTAVALIFSIFLVRPSPFCLLDEVDAPLDDANVGRFNDLLKELSAQSQFVLITHNKRSMENNDEMYGITMQESGISRAISVRME